MDPAVDAQLGDDLRRRIDPLLRGSGIDPGDIGCHFCWHGPDLDVRIDGPTLSEGVRQAIGVHAIGAVGGLGRTIGAVAVQFTSGPRLATFPARPR